jgi:two-component system response regulator AtoC
MPLVTPRILIVDDEEIVRESLADWLAKDGYTVDAAPDGESALARLRSDEWSIALVDLKMPGMDGLQVLEAARKLNPEIAVVMITAYATVETAVRAIKLGATDYIVKPFDPEELSLVVQKILSHQAITRENAALRKALQKDFRFHDIVSRSPIMQRSRSRGRRHKRHLLS